MTDRTFVIGLLATLRPRMLMAFKAAEALVKSGEAVEVIVRIRKSKRSIEQNKRYWALLREVAATVWIDGRQFSDERGMSTSSACSSAWMRFRCLTARSNCAVSARRN